MGSEAVTAVRRDDDALGPLARFLGQLFLVGAVVYLFNAVDVRPSVGALLLGPALGCVLLAPRAALLRARVSLPVVALLLWVGLSWVWSASPATTLTSIRVGIPLLLATVVVVGLLPSRDVTNAALVAVRLVVVVVIASLLLDPAARAGTNPGWHGTFIHKNTMAAFLVLGLATSLALDRRTTRWLTVAAIVVLIIGSQSATGLSGALLVLALFAWLQLYRRTDEPTSSVALLAATAGLVLATALGIVANLSTIFGVYGKETDLNGRMAIWSSVTDAIAQRPLLGYGLGGILRVEDPTPTTRQLWLEIGYPATHAHNGVLDVVAQIGLVGLALHLLVVVSTVVLAVRCLRRCPSTATWAILVVAAQALMSVSENVLLGGSLLLLILLRTPLLRCVHHDEAPDAATRPSPRRAEPRATVPAW